VKTIVELGFTITQSDKAIFYDFSKIKDSNYIIITAATNYFALEVLAGYQE